MNKKLLAVAIGAALGVSPMLAQAANLGVTAVGADEVKHPVGFQVGGMAQVEIAREEVSTKTAGVTADVHTTTVEDNSRGRFWIAADEDLGGGMRAMAHFEFRVDTTGVCALETGGSTCAAANANTREKWVGLKTGIGTVKLGSIQAPYKYAGGVKWDAFVTTNLEARGNGGMSGGVFGHNNFFDNSVAYTSPSFAGVSFGLAYSFDDVNDTTNGQTADDGDYSAAVEWNGKFGGGFGIHLIGALSHNADNRIAVTPANSDVADQTKIGAKFTFAKNFAVIAQYEMLTDARVVGGIDRTDDKVLFLAFNATIGPVLAAIQYGKTEQGGAATNNDIDYVALGAFYNFSKTFNVFTGYRITDSQQTLAAVDNGVETKVLTFGMRKVF